MMVTIIPVTVSIYSESKLNSHETICKKHDYSHVKIPEEHNKIRKSE